MAASNVEDAQELAPSLAIDLAQRNVRSARIGAYLVAALMPGGAPLDWSTNRPHFWDFLLIRLMAGAASLVIAWMTYRPSALRRAYWLSFGPVIAGAVALEAMIIQVGGYSFALFAGFTQLILGVGVLVYWPPKTVVVSFGAVLGIWLVPALALPNELAASDLTNNFFALLICSVIASASSMSRYAAAVREYDARSKLAETSKQLAKSLAQVRDLSQHKDQFFANLSHELRTPLTLIIAPAEALLADCEESVRPQLASIRRNAERLLKHIDELLDLSKLDAGGLRLNVAPVDLAALARTIFESFKPGVEAKGLELVLDASADTPGMFGDAHRIEIIITNLLGNALKYTPAGGSITLRVTPSETGTTVDVQDTGPGISAENLPRVFDRFYQIAGDDRRKRAGGVGIGLALAQQLSQLHGGKLTVASVEGQGTTFTLWLPKGESNIAPNAIERRQALKPDAPLLRRPEDPFMERVPSVKPAGHSLPPLPPVESTGAIEGRVLVADDHEELLAFISNVLRPHFTVLTATNGQEALDIVRAERPDIVVSDVMMPEMNGTELCRHVKTDPELRQTPIILLTARAGSEATLEAYSSGADDFVAKPFHPGVLLARVRAQLQIRQLGRRVIMQEKLFSVGSLAAGVAHEVRNPVNAILNASKTMMEVELDAATNKSLLSVIVDGAERVEAIISALDAHARPSDNANRTGWCDPRLGMDATIRLLAHKMMGVTIHREFVSTKQAAVPPGPLNQVYLNLIDNAVKCGAKTLWVKMIDDGDDILISVADDGPGIPELVGDRVFDAFFTTRAIGEGTGLGLSLSRQLIRDAGGDITQRKSAAGGAEFVIRVKSHAD